MRRRMAWMLVLALGVVLAPATAAGQKERVGTRINLFAGPVQTFPANQPFHISHGWVLDQSNPDLPPQAHGLYDFTLAIDGQEVREDYVEKFHQDYPDVGRVQWRNWVHNFPAGMTGTHTFTGHWFGSCNGVVAAGFAPGPCERSTKSTTAIGPLTVTVVFVP